MSEVDAKPKMWPLTIPLEEEDRELIEKAARAYGRMPAATWARMVLLRDAAAILKEGRAEQ